MKTQTTNSKERWMIASTVLNGLFGAFKAIFGFLTGNIVVLADALHSFGDVIGAFLVYLAVRFSSHRSERFPVGMNKLEDFAALSGGIIVFIAGYEILREVVFGSLTVPTTKPILTIAFMAAIILLTLIFYRIELQSAKKMNSPGLEADASNWLGDLSANAVVLLSAVGTLFRIPYIDKVAVVILVALIFRSAFNITRRSALSLLDASAPAEAMKNIRQLIEHQDFVNSIELLRVIPAGSVYFVYAVLHTNSQNFKGIHLKVDELSEKIKKQIPNIEEVLIHYEPDNHEFVRHAYLLRDDQSHLSNEFGRAPWVRFEDDKDGQIIHSETIANPYFHEQRGKSLKMVNLLVEHNVDVVTFKKSPEQEFILKFLTDINIITDFNAMPKTDKISSVQPKKA